MIQGRSNQLKDEEILGMLIASILVGGACWLGAVAVLQRLTTVRQEIVFSMFSAYVHTLFGELIGVWFDVHWRRVGIDQLALMKAVRGTTLKHHIDSLLVSVVVTFESTL
jgi:ABC-type bacteriocin/lantibiotic exporter with double-glycine peptidase domain